MSGLHVKHCLACEGGVKPSTGNEKQALLDQLDDRWSLSEDKTEILCVINFKNYHQTMAFVNATAWISHEENHHPDLLVSYNKCQVNYKTHAVADLTENDFICAAKIDYLLARE